MICDSCEHKNNHSPMCDKQHIPLSLEFDGQCDDFTKTDKAKLQETVHFLEIEVKHCEDAIYTFTNVYDGVEVGYAERDHLLANHISFCKKVLEICKQ